MLSSTCLYIAVRFAIRYNRRRALDFGFVERFYSKRRAYHIGNLFEFIKRFIFGDEFSSVNAVGVYGDMLVDVLFVIVCCYYNLTATTKSLASKSSRDPRGKLQ